MPTPQHSLLVSAVKTALKGASEGTLSRKDLSKKVGHELDQSFGSDKAARKQALADALQSLVDDGRIHIGDSSVTWLRGDRKRPPPADEQRLAAAEPVKKKVKAVTDDTTRADRCPSKEVGGASVDDMADSLKAHVSNLAFSTSEDTLWEYFGTCGTITDLALLKDKLGGSRGIAFVTFEKKKGLKQALNLNGELCDGRSISVSKAVGQGERPKTGGRKSDGKGGKVQAQDKRRSNGFHVFVGQIPYKVTEGDLKAILEKCGKMERFDMPFNRSGNRKGTAKGVAYITYKTEEGMLKALELNGTEFCGRALVVEQRTEAKQVATTEAVTATRENTEERAHSDRKFFDAGGKGKGREKGKDKGKGKGKGKERESGKGLWNSREFEVFVGGLPYDIDEAVVRRDFEECGPIARLSMPLDDEGNAKGIAFINYRSKEAMENALQYNEKEYGGVWIRVQKANAPRNSSVRAEDEIGKGHGESRDKDPPVPKLQGTLVKSEGKKQVFDQSDEE